MQCKSFNKARCGKKIGKRLLEKGLINEYQLKEALDRQVKKAQAGVHHKIGVLLVGLGYLQREKLYEVIKEIA